MIRKARFLVLGFFVLSCTVSTVVAGTKSIGSKFDGFSLRDTNGNIHRYQDLKGRKGTAVVFLSKRCPVVGRYDNTIDSIARSYARRGINLIGIYSAASDSKISNYFKALVDDRGILTRQLGARHTPEIFLFDEADTLVYKGAIDDNTAARGARNHYARIAFESVLSGVNVARSQTQAFGCSIRQITASATSSLASTRKPLLNSGQVATRNVSRPNKADSARARIVTASNTQKSTSKFSRTKNPGTFNSGKNVAQAREAFTKKRTQVSGFVTRKKQTQDDENIAQQLANPISPLLRIPIRVDYDDRVGVAERPLWQVSVEPVVPIRLGDSVTLISRTKVPTVRERDVPLQGTSRVFGLGDIEQTFLFTPSKTGTGGLSWGVGPVFLLNTSTDGRLGRRKWGFGPAGAVVLQNDVWTAGLLANHIESFAGDKDRRDISETFANPFLSTVLGGKTTIALSSDSIYDWEVKDWTVPVNLTLSQLLKLGNQPLQIGGGPRYWATSPIGGPRGWGFRIEGTLVFPR